MSLSQSRAQLSMWAILKSPLLASADLLEANKSVIDILSNTEVLAVSDDPLGREGLRLGDSGRHDKSVGEIYVGPMTHGRFAVCMFNREGGNYTMTFHESDLRALGAPSSTTEAGWRVRDVWAHTDNGTLDTGAALTINVPGQDVVMFILTPEIMATQ